MARILKELKKVTGLDTDDPVALAVAVDGLADDGWEKLSPPTQEWVNRCLQAHAANLKAQSEGKPADTPYPGIPEPGNDDEEKASKKRAKSAKPAAKKPQSQAARGRGINLEPGEISPARQGSKQAALIDLLARPQGATFAELHAAMTGPMFEGRKPWSEVTTRSALNWDVHTVRGYGVRTEMVPADQLGDRERANGQDPVPVYHLVLPTGVSAPLPHYALAGAKKAA